MQSALQVTDHILSLPEEKKLLVVGLLWAWWEARSKANAGEERKSTNEVICRARLLTNLLPEVVTNDTGSAEGIWGTHWVPPSPNAWKINVDAAFWEKDLQGVWGFVIRDHLSDAVLAGAGRIAVVRDALCSEAHACLAALQAAADHGMQNIIVETDSQTLVKAFHSEELDRAQGVVLFREAKFIMSTMFNSGTAVHVSRLCKKVAHELARVGRNGHLEHPAL